MSRATLDTTFDPSIWRPDFPILATQVHGHPLAYLDNAATTQRPRQVIQALVDVYEQHYANVHRGIHWLSDQATDRYEEAREKVRRFINAAHREEVIFTHGATESVNLVARSWGDQYVHRGDEILLSEMEHHSNLVPWQQLAARTGAVLNHIPITDDGRLSMEDVPRLLSPATRMVAVAAVSNVLGTINPIAEIVNLAHEAGALVLVDAAQSVPHARTDVQAWGADFVAFSGHKMLGPSGVGILFGRLDRLAAMPPFLGGGSMIRRVRLDDFDPGDVPARFEAGTPPIVPAIGLGAALDYLDQVDLDRISAHERQLARRAHEGLASIGGVRILGPAPEFKSGVVSFVVERVHAHDVAQLLDREGIAVRAGHHCAMPLHARLSINASARASFYLYNTMDEIDRLVDAVERAKAKFRRRH